MTPVRNNKLTFTVCNVSFNCTKKNTGCPQIITPLKMHTPVIIEHTALIEYFLTCLEKLHSSARLCLRLTREFAIELRWQFDRGIAIEHWHCFLKRVMNAIFHNTKKICICVYLCIKICII